MSKKQQKEPFLHIQQTGIKPPVGHMQEIYISRIAEKEQKEQAKRPHVLQEEQGVMDDKKAVQEKEREEQAKLAIDKEKDGFEEEKKEDERKQDFSPYSASQGRKSGQSFQRLKSFKEMNTLERVNYLVEFPKQLAPVSCIFETEENTVRGILVEKSDDSIDIRKNDGKMTTIPIASIKNVKMIGLRK